jgi:dienelactone hydrolase
VFVVRRSVCAALLVLVGAGCSGGSKPSVTSSSGASSTVPGSVYAQPGNFTVGIGTLKLPTGNAVDVWYPANGSVGVGGASYDVRSFLPPAGARALGPNFPGGVRTVANRNAPAAAKGEQFPLVLFSHGYAGFRDESSFLMTWLASWGFIVAAPEHPSRDLPHVLAGANVGHPTSVGDLLGTIDLMRRENVRAASPLNGHVDLSKVAAVGYDAGGPTVIAAAADARVAGYVVLGSDDRAAGAASAPATVGGLPHKPSLFVAAAADAVVPLAGARALSAAAPAPSYEWVIDRAGHNAFDDLCVVASGAGGMGAVIAKSAVGASLAKSLRTVVTDGCTPPAPQATSAWRVVNDVVTAFLRNLVGPDRTLVGLGPSGDRTIGGVNVTVSVRAG